MNARQRRLNERGQRVDVYMNALAEDFPADSKGGALAARLKELLAQAATLDVERAANARKRQQGTEGRDAARTALRRMLKTVWDTHKTLARDRPDTKGLFESPSKLKNDRALVTAARAYADTATPLAGLFAEYDLPPTFFADLKVSADSFDTYTTLQNAGVGAGVDTGAAIEETLRQMDEVVERLHTVVTNKYHDNPARLAAWESARRVERSPRSKTKDDDDPLLLTPPANG